MREKLQKIKDVLEIQRLQTFSDRDTISFSLDYIDWLIENTEKVERYEKALLDIVENPKDVSKFSYQEAYTSSVRIAVKALRLNE